MTDRVALAALNNAEWCDAVSRAHGAVCRFGSTCWINEGSAPPFYPNLVTLDAGPAPLAAIEALVAKRSGAVGIKDSYASLDLSHLGLVPVISAAWLWLDPAATAVAPVDPVATVTAVADSRGLAAWESGWRGGEAGETLFPASLLGDGRIAFLSLHRGGRLVAGAAANRSERVIGVSNVFMAADDRAALPALLHAVRGLVPGLPLVGYEHGETLGRFQREGFENIGPLRVWVRP